jgi:hypothetical protein
MDATPATELPAGPDWQFESEHFVALIVTSIVLPFKPETVLTLGVATCVAAYLLQSFIFVFVNEPSD